MGKETRLSRPTRSQKIELKRHKLDPGTWLVKQDDGLEIIVVSKGKGQVRRLRWGA